MQHKAKQSTQRNTKHTQRKSNHQRRNTRKQHAYNGPALKQHMNHNILSESQKFFIRALSHCYHEQEELLVLIAKTPTRFQKALRIKKAKLQREAEYILNNKLKGVQV